MKTKVLLVVGMLFAGTLAASHAGGARWGNCGGRSAGVRWGGWGGYGGGWGGNCWGSRPYWGSGYCAPRVYSGGWGWGWGAPVVGVRVIAPAPVVVTRVVPARTVVVTRGSLVVAAQEQLAGMGYYGGAIDGDFGPRTSSAIQRFQRDYGLPITGRLDRSTRASLGI